MWRPSMDMNDEKKDRECTWELARAFAEDTRSSTWPPRSYNCSFCMREFRSAQALGGHMNVHRRDRARQAQAARSMADQPVMPCGSVPSCWPDDCDDFVDNNKILYSFYHVQTKKAKNCSSFEDNVSSLGSSLAMHQVCCKTSEEMKRNKEDVVIGEIDLELRLGYIPASNRMGHR